MVNLVEKFFEIRYTFYAFSGNLDTDLKIGYQYVASPGYLKVGTGHICPHGGCVCCMKTL
jgi:hypothetical protein